MFIRGPSKQQCIKKVIPHTKRTFSNLNNHLSLEMDEPLLTIKTLSKFEQLKETHWLMYNYPNKMFNRIRDNGAKFVREGSPLAWFVGRHGMKLWSKLSGHSSYVVLNPMLQRFTLASLVSVLGFLSIRALYEKRQVPLPAVFTMPKTLLGKIINLLLKIVV
jgi:dolichyl-phosphate-mannose--protein O-mannosyl transferase